MAKQACDSNPLIRLVYIHKCNQFIGMSIQIGILANVIESSFIEFPIFSVVHAFVK